MSYDSLSSFSQNVLKFYQQLTGEERRVPLATTNNVIDDTTSITVSTAH
jgi:hypothetical protein